MFSKKIKLFKLFDFEVSIDGSWIFLALLIVWTLAVGYFPYYMKGLSTGAYWIMALFGALGLFFSIILHEMCHSLVARKYGLPMKGITLFIFGGIAEMSEEPQNPKTEFLMASAGPLCSIVISFVFLGIYLIIGESGWIRPIAGIFYYLFHINLILALFNLIPAFPLDGGRILRSLLWFKRKDLRKATRTASRIGMIFGLILIGFGFLNLFYGNFIGAIWMGLIGLFIRGLSKLSYQQVVIRKMLAGEPVNRFLNPQPISVSPSLILESFVQDYVYRFHHKMFPVMEGEKLVGCVSTQELKKVPTEEWNRRTVGEIAESCSPDNLIEPNTDASKALSKMSRTGKSRLLVATQGKLIGIITLKDILKFLSLKLEIEEEESLQLVGMIND